MPRLPSSSAVATAPAGALDDLGLAGERDPQISIAGRGPSPSRTDGTAPSGHPAEQLAPQPRAGHAAREPIASHAHARIRRPQRLAMLTSAARPAEDLPVVAIRSCRVARPPVPCRSANGLDHGHRERRRGEQDVRCDLGDAQPRAAPDTTSKPSLMPPVGQSLPVSSITTYSTPVASSTSYMSNWARVSNARKHASMTSTAPRARTGVGEAAERGRAEQGPRRVVRVRRDHRPDVEVEIAERVGARRGAFADRDELEPAVSQERRDAVDDRIDQGHARRDPSQARRDDVGRHRRGVEAQDPPAADRRRSLAERIEECAMRGRLELRVGRRSRLASTSGSGRRSPAGSASGRTADSPPRRSSRSPRPGAASG